MVDWRFPLGVLAAVAFATGAIVIFVVARLRASGTKRVARRGGRIEHAS